MRETLQVRPWSLAGLLAGVATLAGLLGIAWGSGQDYGALAQTVDEHSRSLVAQARRDDRQDRHMEAIDAVVVGMREDMSTIKAQLTFLVRKARGNP